MQRWLYTVLLSAGVSSGLCIAAIFALPLLVKQQEIRQQPDIRLPVAEPSPLATANSRAIGGATPVSEAHEPWGVTLAGKIAWPSALLLALAMIGWNSRLRRIFGTGTRLVRKISAGGVEMEISAEAVDEIRTKLRGSFRELVGSARDDFERMAELQDLDSHLKTVVEHTLLSKLADRPPAELRATVHIRDIVFRDYLYQLIEYYPLGGGAHRRFSQRYGIIGRSWRSEKSHGTGDAFDGGTSAEVLIEEWGMTRDETHGVLNARPSCLSVILRKDMVPVGILYVDSTIRNAFGDNTAAKSLASELETAPHVIKLAVAVEKTLAPLRLGGPNFNLKDLGQ